MTRWLTLLGLKLHDLTLGEPRRVAHGKCVPLPVTQEPRGRGTHSWPVLWQSYVRDWLQGVRER
jgi:hypothetical protein